MFLCLSLRISVVKINAKIRKEDTKIAKNKLLFKAFNLYFDKPNALSFQFFDPHISDPDLGDRFDLYPDIAGLII
ncbi:MAG: hypothetical protein JWR50_1960 [Mucilaginibacter sp.]|nr:hypothetical protein [Mucilaginibacter sp.]